MDLQRASQLAGIGSFIVAVIGLTLLLYQSVSQAPSSTVQAPPAEQAVPSGSAAIQPTISNMEWLGIGLIVVAILGGGFMHLLAARHIATSKGVKAASEPLQMGRVQPLPPVAQQQPRQLKAATPALDGALIGELKWKVKATEQAVFIEVTNDHVRDDPKREIAVRIDDLRRWIEEKLAYVTVDEVVRAKPPFELQLVGGSSAIFFGDKQRYGFLSLADQKGNMQFNYRRKEAAQFFRIRKGTWRATVTVAWSDRAETQNVCFRLEKPRTVPEIIECPTEAIL